jgi:hypothetical protein
VIVDVSMPGNKIAGLMDVTNGASYVMENGTLTRPVAVMTRTGTDPTPGGSVAEILLDDTQVSAELPCESSTPDVADAYEDTAAAAGNLPSAALCCKSLSSPNKIAWTSDSKKPNPSPRTSTVTPPAVGNVPPARLVIANTKGGG